MLFFFLRRIPFPIHKSGVNQIPCEPFCQAFFKEKEKKKCSPPLIHVRICVDLERIACSCQIMCLCFIPDAYGLQVDSDTSQSFSGFISKPDTLYLPSSFLERNSKLGSLSFHLGVKSTGVFHSELVKDMVGKDRKSCFNVGGSCFALG